MAASSLIHLQEVTRTYKMGEVVVNALKCVDIKFGPGEYVSIMGPSGCGKSTLLNLLGCLDRPSSGKYFLDGIDLSLLDDDRLSSIRGSRLGFIFQSYNLIPQLTVVENISIPLYYQGRTDKENLRISCQLAEKVGLQQRLNHRPQELSGGQQQRVAIARALASNPLVILADEPTGNLDSASGKEILDIFDELHQQGTTLIMVTHDESIARRTMRTIRLKDGEIVDDAWN